MRTAVVVAGAHNDTSTPFNLVSVPALIEHGYDGRGLRVGDLVADELASRRYRVTYRSGDLVISGQLSVPRRAGRFPLVVLAHGYEDPGSYVSGEALSREQSYLASRGYVVLLTDYRNHADSDRDGSDAVADPLGYPEDLINAIQAVRRADLPYVDDSRVGVLGRSMGGGVAMNALVARPGLVDAVALYAPVSSSAADNYQRWAAGRGDLAARVEATYGAPDDSPDFWREASARSYFDRAGVPIQVHHGTADRVCPVEWSRSTVAALREAGQTVEYYEYDGEDHRFEQGWPLMMQRVSAFLDANV